GQVLHNMLADGETDMLASRRRGHDLHTGAVRKRRRQKRMFATDALRRMRSNPLRQPLQHRVGDIRRCNTLEALSAVDPYLAGPVHQNVGDVRAVQPGRERRKISAEVDAFADQFSWSAGLAGPTAEKSMSWLTKTRTGEPCGTFTV